MVIRSDVMFHEAVTPPGSGVTVNETDPMSMGSLKSTLTISSTGTPDVPFAGEVAVISGGVVSASGADEGPAACAGPEIAVTSAELPAKIDRAMSTPRIESDLVVGPSDPFVMTRLLEPSSKFAAPCAATGPEDA